MQNSATVQLQLPIAWLTKIQHLAEQRERSSEEVLQGAIAQYLGVPLPDQESRITQLEADIRALNRQIRQLSTTLSQIQLSAIDTTVASSPIDAADMDTVETVRSQPSGNWIDDDTDDEPDEVLYDFLPPEER